MDGASARLRYVLTSLEDTRAWGIALGAQLHSGDVIALIGDLGAGKTTLTQAIAAGMGITDPVTSPTFALAQEYLGPTPLFHFDPYRLDSQEAFHELGFEDYFERRGVIVVEWADKVLDLLPQDRLTVALSEVEQVDEALYESTRRLCVEANGTRSKQLLAQLKRLPQAARLLEQAS